MRDNLGTLIRILDQSSLEQIRDLAIVARQLRLALSEERHQKDACRSGICNRTPQFSYVPPLASSREGYYNAVQIYPWSEPQFSAGSKS